jgi:hypothetical protein
MTDGRLLFEWWPGLPIDDDLYLLDGMQQDGDEHIGVLPEPVVQEVGKNGETRYEAD